MFLLTCEVRIKKSPKFELRCQISIAQIQITQSLGEAEQVVEPYQSHPESIVQFGSS